MAEYTDKLDFEVVKRPIKVQMGPDKIITCTKKIAIVNDKTDEILSFMTPNYRLFTNQEFMALTEQIGNTLGLELDHYASHKGGKKVLSAFKQTDSEFNLLGHTFTNHIILFDSRDGSKKLSIGGNGVLHRCQNMFTSTDVHFSVNHSFKLDEMLAEFQVALEMFGIQQRDRLQRLEKLADIKISQEQVFDFIANWVGLDKKQVKALALGKNLDGISTRKSNIVEGLSESWRKESKDLGANGFGLWNMTTDYFSNNRDKGDTDLLFGDFGRKEKETIQFAEALAF